MATVCVQRTPFLKGLDSKPDIFMGDGEGLLDRLVASCEAHKTLSPAKLLPGFGRNLVPYFAEGEFEASVSIPNARPAKQQTAGPTKGQKRSQGERSAGKRSPEKSRPRCDSSVQYSVTTEVPRSPTPTRDTEPPRGRPAKADKKLRAAVLVPSLPAGPRAAPKKVGELVIEQQWAGPGYHASPEPQALPMPGELLIRRSNSATAPQVDALATQALKSILQVAAT